MRFVGTSNMRSYACDYTVHDSDRIRRPYGDLLRPISVIEAPSYTALLILVTQKGTSIQHEDRPHRARAAHPDCISR